MAHIGQPGYSTAAALVVLREALHEAVLLFGTQSAEPDFDAMTLQPHQADLQQRNARQTDGPVAAAKKPVDFPVGLVTGSPRQQSDEILARGGGVLAKRKSHPPATGGQIARVSPSRIIRPARSPGGTKLPSISTR